MKNMSENDNKKPIEKKSKPSGENPFKPLPVIEDDQGALDEEMEELFREDEVRHKHGSAEPEKD